MYQGHYNGIKANVTIYLRDIGYRSTKIPFVPISRWARDNMFDKSINIPWYKNPYLLEALDTTKEPARPTDKLLRLLLQDVYRVGGIDMVPVGRTETGILKPGMAVTFASVTLETEVQSMEMNNEVPAAAVPGDIVGFNVKKLSTTDIRRRYVADDPQKDPPTGASMVKLAYRMFLHFGFGLQAQRVSSL